MFGKFRNRKGASLTDYGIVVGMISVVGIAAVNTAGVEIGNSFQSSQGSLSEAVASASNGGSSAGEEASADSGTYSKTYVMAYLDPSHPDAAHDYHGSFDYHFYSFPSDGGYSENQRIANNHANYQSIHADYTAFNGFNSIGAPIDAGSNPQALCLQYTREFSVTGFQGLYPHADYIVADDVTGTIQTTTVNTSDLEVFSTFLISAPETFSMPFIFPDTDIEIVTSFTCSRERQPVDPI